MHNSVRTALSIETTRNWYTKKHARTHAHTHTHTDVTVLWNQAVYTDREVTANRPDIIMKNKIGDNMHSDKCDNASEQIGRKNKQKRN